MGMSVEEAVKDIQTREEIFVVYSRASNLPYVSEGEESFADQVWFFASEDEIKEFGKKKAEEKIPLFAMKYEKKDYPKMYGLIFTMGADAIVWNNGEEQVEIELKKIVREPDLSSVDPQKRPLTNPTLQLAGAYFMQELRRPIGQDAPEEEKKARAIKLHELDEQLVANIRKSEYLVAMNPVDEESRKLSIPYLKNKDGKILQPAFSDVLEFQKFARGQKLRVAKVPFEKLEGLLIEQAEALVINPLGFNLPLNRDQLKKIAGYPAN